LFDKHVLVLDEEGEYETRQDPSGNGRRLGRERPECHGVWRFDGSGELEL
jgi:hypothetical protein